MAEVAPRIFDAHLHPEGLSDRDLESMHFFGVEVALVAAHQFPEATARALLAHFDDVVEKQLPRLARAGIRAYAALGVHPDCIPRRGLPEVLSKLPSYFSGGKVVAVGAIGLKRADAEEEEAFLEQLALARRLKLPILVQSPINDKERVTRRLLNLVKQSGINPGRLLIDRVDGRTLRLIVECGHFAGLTIHPDGITAERAAALIRKHGSERIVTDSNAGLGSSDILGLPRLVSLLAKAKLSAAVTSRVTLQNGLECLRIPAS